MTKKTKLIIIITGIITALFLILSFIFSLNNGKEKNVIEANSVRLLASSNEIPTDVEITPDDLEGYHAGISYVFTKNIDKEKAVEALKDYLVFYNGEPVHIGIDIDITIKDSGWATTTCTFPDGTRCASTTGYKVVDAPDGIEYAACTPWGGARYAIVVAKSSVTSESNINQIPLHAFNARFINFDAPTFDFDYNDCLQAECETWLKSYVQYGNGKNKLFYANLRILDDLTVEGFEGNGNDDEYIAPDDYVIPTEPNMPPIDDTTDEIQSGSTVATGTNNIEEAINKIKENDAAKITTGIISCVLGAGVIYLVFILLRKLFKCLRK